MAAASGLLQRFQTGRHDMLEVFIAPLAAQWDAVRRLLEKQRVDALLCDIAFTGVLPLVLSPLPRPRVAVCGVSPLMLSSSDTPPFGMSWQPKPFMNYSRMNRVVSDILSAGSVQPRCCVAFGRRTASPVFFTDWPLLADHVRSCPSRAWSIRAATSRPR